MIRCVLECDDQVCVVRGVCWVCVVWGVCWVWYTGQDTKNMQNKIKKLPVLVARYDTVNCRFLLQP